MCGRICIEQIAELKNLKGIRGIHILGTDGKEKIGQIVKQAVYCLVLE